MAPDEERNCVAEEKNQRGEREKRQGDEDEGGILGKVKVVG